MIRRSLQHCDWEGLRKPFSILGIKYQGTNPGNFKVLGSNLQLELIFRTHNNNQPGSPHPHHRPITPHSRQSESAGNARATIEANLGAWRRELEP